MTGQEYYIRDRIDSPEGEGEVVLVELTDLGTITYGVQLDTGAMMQLYGADDLELIERTDYDKR